MLEKAERAPMRALGKEPKQKAKERLRRTPPRAFAGSPISSKGLFAFRPHADSH